MLVVIDTNVLISYFIRYNSPVGRAVDQILARHTPVCSSETLTEFVGKISQAKFKAYVDADTVRRFVDHFVAMLGSSPIPHLSKRRATRRTTSSWRSRSEAMLTASSQATATCWRCIRIEAFRS